MGFIDPRQSNSSNSNFGRESDFLVGGWAAPGPYQGNAGSNYSDRLLIPKDPTMANLDEEMKRYILNQPGYNKKYTGQSGMGRATSSASRPRQMASRTPMGQLSFAGIDQQLQPQRDPYAPQDFAQQENPRLRSLAEGRARAGLSPRGEKDRWGQPLGSTAERDQWGHKLGPGR